ncbi:MAG: hypothetical protein A2W31_10975 [Planctomycetes bacterium RBG_16_64_10]|nr:MAG: hypothetical protein A2W31_10975 [Planctomycetes bacterium RBG_16_64_10]
MPIWRANDAEERRGITEIHHVDSQMSPRLVGGQINESRYANVINEHQVQFDRLLPGLRRFPCNCRSQA